MRLFLSAAVRGSVLTMALLSFPLSGTPQSSANATSHFSFAYVQENCGPTDGIAMEFLFTATQGQGGKYKEPFLVIEVNENLPKSAPQNYSVKSGTSAVLASRCLKAGSCELATSGFLHLSKFSRGVGASGDYELHFRDGSLERKHFDATWYRNYFLCG
jgi:hypothetical protein